MKTYRPMLKYLGPLFAVTALAAGARAADMPVPKTEAPPPNKAPSNPYTWPVAILSTGLGLAVFGIIMRQVEEDAFWPLLGSGCMIAIIGAGLFLNAYLRPRVGYNG